MTEANSELCCRSDWLVATEFLSDDAAHILNLISERVVEVAQAGKTPVVVFDLDSTLYEVQPRTYQIIQEYLASDASASLNKALYKALKTLSVGDL